MDETRDRGSGRPDKQALRAAREARRAAALRENLQRRKQQARQRRAGSDTTPRR